MENEGIEEVRQMGGYGIQKEIWAVCNTGLGSSLFVEMNITSILAKHCLSDQFCAKHGALFDADWSRVFCAVVASDLAPHIAAPCPVVALDSIIDMEELERKLIDVIGS